MAIKQKLTNTRWLPLFLVIGLALFLRIHRLDFQSLWLDELYTMRMADPANNFAGIYNDSVTNDPLSFVYFALLNLTFKVFAYTGFVARAISVLFGILGVYFIYLLGKELFGKRAGLSAALLLAVNYFHIFYSQDARSYTMFSAATTLSFLYLVRYIKTPGTVNAVKFALAAAWMVLSHKFGVSALLSQFILFVLSLLYYRSVQLRLVLKHMLIAVLVFAICLLPEYHTFVFIAQGKSSWIPPANLNSLASVFTEMFGGSFIISSMMILAILLYIIRLYLPLPGAENNEDGPAFVLLLTWILVSFFVPYFKSFSDFPILYSRYLINILPALCLLGAAGISLSALPALRIPFLVVFILVSLLELFIAHDYYFRRTKSDFRGAALFVHDHNPGKYPVYTSLPYQFHYYFQHYDMLDLMRHTAPATKVSSLRAGRDTIHKFWLADAHHRELQLSDSDKVFLEKNFIREAAFEGRGSFAYRYAPIPPKDTVAVMELNTGNFYEQPLKEEIFINIWSGEVRSRAIDLPAGDYLLILNVESSPHPPLNNQYAMMRVSVDNNEIAHFPVQHVSDRGDSLLFRHSGGLFSLRLALTNDLVSGNKDRNIHLRRIRFFRIE